MSYLGIEPANQRASQNRVRYTAGAGQTSFAATYSSPDIDVYQNGSKLIFGVDFVATNGTTVVLTVGAASGDDIDICSIKTSNPYDNYTKSQIDALQGIFYAVAGGSVDAMAVTTTPLIPALVNGIEVRIRVSGANTSTTPTVTFSNLGVAKTITARGNKPLLLSAFQAGEEITLRYNSITDKLELIGGNVNYSISKLMPLTATVASSALTITCPAPFDADFRSPNLSSGLINPRSIATSVSLVVPSTATLGAISAVQSRLIAILIDASSVGGTLELGIVNISGGFNLDETALVSTTAISAAATSASVVYSNIARTSLPFRVLGAIESTQATTGTWATAPSLVQPSGGQSITGFSSLGYGQTWQSFNVGVQRSVSTTYYNTTGKPIMVNVSMSQNGTNTLSITVSGVNLGPSSVPSVSANFVVMAIVPPGASYLISGGSTVLNWYELR